MLLLPSVEIMHLHFIFIFLHMYPLCTVCQVQPRLVSARRKKTEVPFKLNTIAVRIKDSNGLVSLWLSVDIFYFINFDAVGRNFLLSNTSHVLSETQRQATKSIIASFVSSISSRKPFLYYFAKEILPPSAIVKSLHVFNSLTLTAGISQSIFIQKSGGIWFSSSSHNIWDFEFC